MQWDVLESLQAFGDRRKISNVEAWDALEELAPTLTCWAYGHPEQPKPRRKWRDRPWRCDRCGTWWVTAHYHDYSNYDVGGAWRWVRVEVDQ